jgi:hypothetical protein
VISATQLKDVLMMNDERKQAIMKAGPASTGPDEGSDAGGQKLQHQMPARIATHEK